MGCMEVEGGGRGKIHTLVLGSGGWEGPGC